MKIKKGKLLNRKNIDPLEFISGKARKSFITHLLYEPLKGLDIELRNEEDIPIKERLRKKQHDKIIKRLKYDTKIFPGIRFDNKSQPIKVVRPLELHELKLIVALRCDIELRSPRTARAYKRSNKDISFIQKKLDESSYQRTVIRHKNNYPYNLKPNLQHWIAWSKGYTWQELEQQLKDK